MHLPLMGPQRRQPPVLWDQMPNRRCTMCTPCCRGCHRWQLLLSKKEGSLFTIPTALTATALIPGTSALDKWSNGTG